MRKPDSAIIITANQVNSPAITPATRAADDDIGSVVRLPSALTQMSCFVPEGVAGSTVMSACRVSSPQAHLAGAVSTPDGATSEVTDTPVESASVVAVTVR